MHIRFFTLVFFVSLVGCVSDGSSASNAYMSTRIGHFRVHVFDCEIEIPNEYSLHTNESSMYRFSKINRGVGSISIDNLDESAFTNEAMKIVDSKKVGGLNVIFLEVSLSLNKTQTKDMVVIHNNKQAINIIGDDLNLWDDFIHTCTNTRKPWKRAAQ